MYMDDEGVRVLVVDVRQFTLIAEGITVLGTSNILQPPDLYTIGVVVDCLQGAAQVEAVCREKNASIRTSIWQWVQSALSRWNLWKQGWVPVSKTTWHISNLAWSFTDQWGPKTDALWHNDSSPSSFLMATYSPLRNSSSLSGPLAAASSFAAFLVFFFFLGGNPESSNSKRWAAFLTRAPLP